MPASNSTGPSLLSVPVPQDLCVANPPCICLTLLNVSNVCCLPGGAPLSLKLTSVSKVCPLLSSRASALTASPLSSSSTVGSDPDAIGRADAPETGLDRCSCVTSFPPAVAPSSSALKTPMPCVTRKGMSRAGSYGEPLTLFFVRNSCFCRRYRVKKKIAVRPIRLTEPATPMPIPARAPMLSDEPEEEEAGVGVEVAV